MTNCRCQAPAALGVTTFFPGLMPPRPVAPQSLPAPSPRRRNVPLPEYLVALLSVALRGHELDDLGQWDKLVAEKSAGDIMAFRLIYQNLWNRWRALEKTGRRAPIATKGEIDTLVRILTPGKTLAKRVESFFVVGR